MMLPALLGKALLPILIRTGTPILADIVGKNIGGGAGAVVTTIGKTIGVAVDNQTPDAIERSIIDMYNRDPKGVTASIREVESVQADEWAEYYEQQGEAVRALIDADQKDATSDSFLRRTWRPMTGVMATVNTTAFVFAVIYLALTGNVSGISALAELVAILIFVFGGMWAATGVYVNGRTQERLAGKI